MQPYFYIGSIEFESYYFFNSLALYAAILINLTLFRERKRESRHMTTIFSRMKRVQYGWPVFLVEVFLISYAQNGLGGLCNGQYANLVQGGGGNYFGLLFFGAPVFLIFLMIFAVDPIKQFDWCTPAYAMSLVFFKLACLLHGCCQGKPWEHGIYFYIWEDRLIPSQLLEMVVALAMFIYLLYRLHKPYTLGTMFPIYMIIYSVTRFFTEFTREADFIYWGLCSYQIQCLVGILVGLVEYFLALKFGQSVSDWFEKKNCQNLVETNK